MTVFYNDSDRYVAQWLGNLIAAGHLAQGTVDAHAIQEIESADLGPFRQCHFFAGIGGWPYALSLAGWPEDREVWTASCPCQPLSSAGQRRGHADERHLWPALYHLIAECRPATIFGEQVASHDGREWLAGVRADLEALGYAVGAADLCAAGAGAPHIRQRLYWVADSAGNRTREPASPGGRVADPNGGQPWNGHIQSRRQYRQQSQDRATGGLGDAEHAERRPLSRSEQDVLNGHDTIRAQTHGQPGACREVRGMGDTIGSRLEERAGERRNDERQRSPTKRDGRAVGGVGDATFNGRRQEREIAGRRGEGDQPQGSAERSRSNHWSSAEWLPCLDGKARRIEPGTFPLAHGVPARVGRLRAYGNAIVPQVAAEFVKAFTECEGL